MKDQGEDFADQLGRYLLRAGFTQQELADKIGMHRNTIVKWMNRNSLPTHRGQVLQLAVELSLLKEERKAFLQAARFSLERWPTEVWTVPVPRDLFFTGRDRVFRSLQELLVPGSTMALTQAISGLGGIGKTHTAAEYAYRFHQNYEAVLWLQADSWEVLVSECIKLADELGLPEQKEADKVVSEVQRWLRKHRNWLLILDNVEHPQKILPTFIPTGHQGSVLITTRVQHVEPLAQTQVLSIMSEQEGILFLLRRTKKLPPDAELEQASMEMYHQARPIWQEMNGLPLALDQAGAYILETSCTFADYQTQYTRRRRELLDRRGQRFIGHEASVATTFSLAFERVATLKPVTTDILQACSLLHSEAIPEEFFLEGTVHLGSRLASEREGWDMALELLQEYSLVQRNPDAKTLTIHRLVQAVLRDSQSELEHKMWAKRVLAAMNTVFPLKPEHDTWNQCERYLPHALACTNMIEQEDIKLFNATSLLDRVGYYLRERGKYAEAEPLFKRALAICEQELGASHPHTATSLNNLATLYKNQGKYAETEPLYLRALSIYEQQLGAEHPETANSLNNLAELYRVQGKYEQAEPLYLRALLIREQQLGVSHSTTATSLNNLALLYKDQGKYAEAEPLYLRALSIYEQQLGAEHPDTATSLNNLALLYKNQGKYAEAEPLYLRAFSIREQQLGAEHPETANSLNNLASLYQDQGKYAEAELLYQRALAIREQELGTSHPDTAGSLNNLALHYQAQGQYEQAEPLYLHALSIYEQQLGAEHPDTATSLNNLASLYQNQGKYAEAEPLLKRALSIREQQLGAEHPDTATSLNNLASLYQNQGKYAEAEPLLKRALSIREQQLGAEHPDTAISLNNLALHYQDQGKYAEAEPLLKRALLICEQQLGREHPTTQTVRKNYAHPSTSPGT